MSKLTRDSVWKILGPVDDELTAELVKTGAEEDELFAAQTWLGADEAMHEARAGFPRGRVAVLVDLINEHEAAVEEPR